MSHSFRLVVLACSLAGLLCACVTKLTSDTAPGVDLSRYGSFYVEKQPKDGRDLQIVIADQLTLMGHPSSCGEPDTLPATADVLVTYVDRWRWDITMYLIQLDIQFRDPATRTLLASGSAHRSSLARKSSADMASEVLAKIFDVPSPAEVARPDSKSSDW